ncbi:hypothetical protein KFK09_012609 [Dendrobium nobile]|uniref:Uncharacterized protein n=1 Tax=Dendrobium nobile TaxID=94219 RepID=A0A8T3BJL0_DENNO|nr:hypothetical protein KFK09_012609 [Dendrobium nobile]
MTRSASFRRAKKVTHRGSSSVEQISRTSNNTSTPVLPNSSNANDCNNNEQSPSQSSEYLRRQVPPADDGIWLIGFCSLKYLFIYIYFNNLLI